MVDRIIQYICVFLALLVVLPLHELAHGVVAVKCGDPTPKFNGRMTLNPLAHVDLIGLACFVLAGFGWSNPMPINPYNFKNYKWNSFFVAIAGIIADYIIAFLIYPLFMVVLIYLLPLININLGYFDDVLVGTLSSIYSISLTFMVINLLPIYPYDCFRAIDALTSNRGKVFNFLRTKGIYIIYALFGLSILADITGLYYLEIFGMFISFMTSILGYPISLFWGLIF